MSWDPYELAQLPLSAYTPGMGDLAMEGGYETASGHPVYTFEDYIAGKAPYVTGATSAKNPSGQLVYRQIGDQTVPVRITDHGPGVKGIDIASSNPKWATNFPYQGATEGYPAGATGNISTGQGGAPSPWASYLPPPSGYLPGGQPFVPGGRTMDKTTWTNYAGVGQVPNAIAVPGQGGTTWQDFASAAGKGLESAGAGLQKSSQSGMQQALSMMKSSNNAQQILAQLAANPTMYLNNPYLTPPNYGNFG